MADVSSISFIFKAATSPNLEDLRRRSSSPSLQHLYNDTLNFYEEYLRAREAGYKLVMTRPDQEHGIEIDDEEHPVMHKPMGIITLKTDLTRAHALATLGGFVATQNMLTRAFILRERVTEAVEYGWRVGFLDQSAVRIEYQPSARFSLMDMPSPTTLQ